MIDVLRPDSLGAVSKANLTAASKNFAPETYLVVVDETELRIESSTFWGSAFGSSLWDGPTLNHNEKLRLNVPLPALASEIFASSNGLADRSVVAREAPTGPEESLKNLKKEEEPFVIKRGAKRKSDVISDEEELKEKTPKPLNKYHFSAEDVVASPASQEKAAQKAARKAEKRAKKGAKKSPAAEAGVMEDSTEVDDEEPFDYSKADSVLHGKRNDGEKGEKKKGKPFDPYRKSEDAPKGMRRLQTERAGKSHTFNS
jgi:exosome complex exonuclease RRP6